MDTVFSLSGVNYAAGSKQILSDISFDIKEGDVFALLGHNGSGKTTMIDVIMGDITPQQGRVQRHKMSYGQRGRLGIVYDRAVIFPLLTVSEIIHYFSVIHRLDYSSIAPKYLESFELQHARKTPLYKLSSGERRKTAIMLAVLHQPDILILDEPFAAIDPLVAGKVWQHIATPGRTIFFTTHDWNFASRYATRICFMHKGRLLHLPASPAEYLDMLPGKTKMVAPYNKEIETLINGNAYYVKDDKISFFATDFKPYMKGIQLHTRNFSLLDADITDVYMFLLKKHSYA